MGTWGPKIPALGHVHGSGVGLRASAGTCDIIRVSTCVVGYTY